MSAWLPCRGCLGSMARDAQAGLCGRCWAGLAPLPEGRCPACALPHPWADPCPEPVAWDWGDALWDYHAGRPALGALLVPGIKRGEWGWKAALLGHAARVALPGYTAGADLVCPAPTALWRRWQRGFDLAAEAANLFAGRLGKPALGMLRKPWLARAQAGLAEGQRRRLGARSVALDGAPPLAGRSILLVDDVWTTGTTLLRCAEALLRGGAAEVRVLTLFRSWSRHRGSGRS